jgi:hypothetical protein
MRFRAGKPVFARASATDDEVLNYAVVARALRMLSFADSRSFTTIEDRYQHCTFCGRDLVVLPNDRRGGSCFDCLSLLGPEAAPCPQCQTEIAPSRRALGCVRCGWSPGRD